MGIASSRDLRPDETELQGDCIDLGTRVVWDEVNARISYLVRERLQSVAHADDGWAHLFRDPGDGRLWELYYPAGGHDPSAPRTLHVLRPDEAARKYGLGAG